MRSIKPLSRQPWFEVSKSEHHKKHAIVVGAGIAGVTTAWALTQRGWQIDLVEQHGNIAQEGSGNPMGILLPRISLNESVESEFYAKAYFKAIDALTQLKKEDSVFSWQQGGVLQLASSPRIVKQIDKLHCDDDFVQVVSAKRASEIAGVSINCKALYFQRAGWLNPVDLCERLIKHSGGRVKVHFNTAISRLYPQDAHWQLFDQNNQLKLESEIVVLANAAHATQFQQTDWLPLTPARGQISIQTATKLSKNIRCAICYEGYILPETDGAHVIGATFTRGDRGTEIRKEDDTENLQKLERWFSRILDGNEIETKETELKSRAAIRAVTPDRMPLVGPVADIHYFKIHYHDLHKGKGASNYPSAKYLRGFYLNVGHGAKGLCSSFLSAKLIASQINGEALGVSKLVQQALNPSRFIIRNLQKGKKIL